MKKLGLIILLSLFVSTAFASKCKKVKIKVENNTGHEVRVKKLEFYDDPAGKWRDEQVKNSTIKNGNSHTYEENLGYVLGRRVTKFKVKYDYRLEDGTMSKDIWSNEIKPTATGDDGNLTCKSDRTTYIVDFTKEKFKSKP